MAELPPKRSNRPDAPGADASSDKAPARERRSRHRVADDQSSGRGSLSALSKLRMLERRRAALEPLEPPQEKPATDKPSR